MPNAAERFFFNVDTLLRLLGEIDDTNRVSLALLCKATSDIALDCLWRQVDGLVPLFRILAPLVPEKENRALPILRFARQPRPEQWKRFESYARRVRHLRFCDNPYEEEAVLTNGLLSLPAFELLHVFCMNRILFPNLRTLQWLSSAKFMPYINLFIHPNLEEIRLGYSSVDGLILPDPGTIIHQIVSRVPNLERLYINAMFGQRGILEEVFRALPCLTKLSILAFPRLWINSELVERCRRMSVKTLDVIPYPSPFDHVGDVGNVRDFLYQMGHVISLEHLRIEATLEDIFYLLDSPDAPQHLKSLVIKSIREETPSMLYEFLQLAARTLTSLTTLHLILVPDDLEEIDWTPVSTPVTVQDLEPLQDFQELRDFRIDNVTPIDITEDELCSLIQPWTNLEIFSLCPQPVVESCCRSQLTLASLVPFMIYCPHLISLSLWVDATRFPTFLFPQPPADTPSVRFGDSFKKLDLGSSRINEMDKTFVTNYLVHYFPRFVPRHNLSRTTNPTELYEPQLRVFNRFGGALRLLMGHERLRRIDIWRQVASRLPGLVLRREAGVQVWV